MCAKDRSGKAFTLEHALCNLELCEGRVGVGDVKCGVSGSPKERHDGNEGWKVHEESANGCGSVDSAEGILDVGGNEKFVWCCECYGSEVVNHAVGTAFHEGAILIWSNGIDNIGLGDVKNDSGGKFE